MSPHATSKRLERELIHNVALRVEQGDSLTSKVSGRGELHLSVLIGMRREGLSWAYRDRGHTEEIDGQLSEPYEHGYRL